MEFGEGEGAKPGCELWSAPSHDSGGLGGRRDAARCSHEDIADNTGCSSVAVDEKYQSGDTAAVVSALHLEEVGGGEHWGHDEQPGIRDWDILGESDEVAGG